MTYIPNPQQISGGQTRTVVTDDAVQEILGNMLKELKKMNLKLDVISDMNITDQEIE